MCHLCESMQPYRDLPQVTSNGYSNHTLSSLHSEPSFGSHYGKFAGLRGGMAVATDIYSNHHHGHLNHAHMHHVMHHHHHNVYDNYHSHGSIVSDEPSSRVRVWDIWAHNFEKGMRLVRRLLRDSRFVAIDTEFPGVVAKVSGEFASNYDLMYHNIKVNIDILKPIQIGFSFFNERGKFVDQVSTVQFNLKWDVNSETHAADSIQLLEDSGIDFNKLKNGGIELHTFAETFLTSGLVLNDKITWVGFHSAYDFAYLMKLCTNWPCMPDSFTDFQKHLKLYFPRIVDLKSMMSEYKLLKGGLQELADALRVPRIGEKHQAGSDAMLTGETFFRFIEEHCDGKLEPHLLNLVYGLNNFPTGLSFAGRGNAQSPQLELESVLRERSNLSVLHHPNVHSADHSGRVSTTSSNGDRSS